MKFRIGFVSNSSASSFLVTDRSLDLENVKKRIAKALGRESIDKFGIFDSFDIVDEEYMTYPHNGHLDLPFLHNMLAEIDEEYTRELRSDRREKLVKIQYYEKKQRIVEQYIQTDEFKKKYKGMVYFYTQSCDLNELFDEKLSDIGYSVYVSEPYGPGRPLDDPDETDENLGE